MTTPANIAGPDLRNVVARALRGLSEVSGLPVSFGGQVARDGRSFTLTELYGTRTQSLRQLRVGHGMGLGGKALELLRPVIVQDYQNAQGITHRYDQAVAPERLQTVVSIPIQVRNAVRAVVYVASRAEMSVGDRLVEQVGPVLRRLERDLTIEEEVYRRVAKLTEAGESPPTQPVSPSVAGETRELYAELVELADSVDEESVRVRLRSLCDRMASLSTMDSEPPSPVESASTVRLTHRERDVLSYVSIGCTNDDIAERLGLLPNTVKAYVKTAIRKMGGANRFQAAYRAKMAGLIDTPPEQGYLARS